jgi:hypothetical protein
MNLNFMVSTVQVDFEKNVVSAIISNMPSSLGIEKRYFTVILLIAQISTHILQDLSFLGVKSAGTVLGLRLSRTKKHRLSFEGCESSVLDLNSLLFLPSIC